MCCVDLYKKSFRKLYDGFPVSALELLSEFSVRTKGLFFNPPSGVIMDIKEHEYPTNRLNYLISTHHQYANNALFSYLSFSSIMDKASILAGFVKDSSAALKARAARNIDKNISARRLIVNWLIRMDPIKLSEEYFGFTLKQCWKGSFEESNIRFLRQFKEFTDVFSNNYGHSYLLIRNSLSSALDELHRYVDYGILSASIGNLEAHKELDAISRKPVYDQAELINKAYYCVLRGNDDSNTDGNTTRTKTG